MILHLVFLVLIFFPYFLGIGLNLKLSKVWNFALPFYFGFGAYLYFILNKNFNFEFLSSLLIAILTAVILGYLQAKYSHKFDIETQAFFGFALIGLAKAMVEITKSQTGGNSGLYNFSGSTLNIRYLASFSILLMLVFYLFSNSIWFLFFQAFGESKKYLILFGVDTGTIFDINIVVSGVLATISGCFYANYISFVDPTIFGLSFFIQGVSVFAVSKSFKPIEVSITFIIIFIPELLRFLLIGSNQFLSLKNMCYGIFLLFVIISKDIYEKQNL